MVKTLKTLWQSNAKSKSEIEKRKQNCEVDFTSLSKVFEIRWRIPCMVKEGKRVVGCRGVAIEPRPPHIPN